jgi:hypothetical protein
MKRSILMILKCTQLQQKEHIMRLRLIFLALAAMLQFSSLSVPATAQTSGASAVAGNLSGNWTVTASGLHFRSGTYQLSQVNNVVVGITNPVLGQNSAQIEGTMHGGGIVEGTWRGPTGETGWFNMHVTSDGKAFSGQYGFNGRKAEGALVGHLAA